MSFGDLLATFDAPNTAPNGIAWDGTYLWIADSTANLIYKCDPSDLSVVDSIAAPAGNASGLAWDGTHLWLCDLNAGFFRINPATGATVTSFDPANPQFPDAVAWDGSSLWATNVTSDTIYKLNPSTGATLDTITAPESGISGLAWDPTTSTLWASSSGTSLYQLDPGDGTVLDTVTAPNSNLSALGFSGTGTYHLWAAQGIDDEVYKLKAYNALPTAPTGLSFGATTVRRDQDQTLTWTPNDPDGDNPQDSEVRWRTGGGAWTTVTADTFGSNGVAGSGQHTIAAGTLAAGQWEFQVRTADTEDWGAWSSSLFVTFANPPTVTLDDPDDDETIGESPYTVAWTAASQTHYQIRTVADSGGSPDTGTVYTDTGEVASGSTRSRQVAYAQNGLTVHTQLRIKAGGVWSDWQSHRNPVAYTPPLTPEVVVGLNPANSPVNGTPAGIYQQISATHPEPDDEPDPASLTIHRQEQHPVTQEWGIWQAGAWRAGGSLTIAEGADPDAVITDTRVAHRREYRYRVAAVAATGAASLSDWSEVLIDDGGGPVDEYDTIDDGGAP